MSLKSSGNPCVFTLPNTFIISAGISTMPVVLSLLDRSEHFLTSSLILSDLLRNTFLEGIFGNPGTVFQITFSKFPSFVQQFLLVAFARERSCGLYLFGPPHIHPDCIIVLFPHVLVLGRSSLI